MLWTKSGTKDSYDECSRKRDRRSDRPDHMAARITTRDFPFSFSFRVRYAEVDAQGIVFNANYLVYLDTAVTEYFREQGRTYGAFVKETGMDFHVTRSVVDYKKPARFDEEILVCLKGAYAGVRIFWEAAIFRGDDLLCTAELVYASVDTETGRPRIIDAEIASGLGFVERSRET